MVEKIRRILVVGAGTMGQQIALQCAMHGYQVHVYDIVPQVLVTAKRRVEEYIAELQASNRLTEDEARSTLGRLQYFEQAESAAQEVDLLSESIVEDPMVKGKAFALFNRLCPERTIFTTNTSTLLPSKFAKATGRPAQFAAFHFHNPVWDANVVDVMPHPGTDTELVPRLVEFARSIDQIPIVIHHETASYVFNAMLDGFLRPALMLAADGKASVEDIDRAWMGVTKMKAGPFGIMDLIGVDLIYHISTNMPFYMKMVPSVKRLLYFLKQYVDQGRLGIKSGKGFYNYPNPSFSRPGFILGGDLTEENKLNT
jgi:3-hydroxybutyryl-CoA dehydrogenase